MTNDVTPDNGGTRRAPSRIGKNRTRKKRRRDFDWVQFAAFAGVVGLAMSGVWVALDRAIGEVDQDVERLTTTVETLVKDVAFIKGHLGISTGPSQDSSMHVSQVIVPDAYP